MATAPNISQARLFANLLAELEPEVRRAFMASVTDLQANVDWTRLLAELANMNTEGAIAALNISPEAWAEYSASVTSAYAKAGASTAAQITQQGIGTIGTRFQMSNPRAQAWIAENVGESIVGFTREAQMTARTVIEAGYALGQGPRNIAVDLVGRVQGGVRTGGVLGLDNPRAMRLQAVTAGMRTPEGVRDLVAQHLDGTISVRYQVNPATEQRILKAFRAGTEVPLNERVISERQYASALLKARGDTVAATETANAVMAARQEQWVQLAEAQGLDARAVKKTWQHRRGGAKEFRPAHLAMSGKTVQGLFTPFIFPDGTRMQYAHDPAGGARNNINCGCDTTYSLNRAYGLL